MGMASKGPRTVVTSRVPNDLYEILEARREEAGVHSVSQFVSYVLADYVGRTDLILEVDQKALPKEGVVPAA